MLIAIILIVVALFYLIESAVLLLTSKMFKINNLDYKKSLIVIGLSFVITLILALILSLIPINNSIGQIILAIIGFIIFHYFYKKYSLTSWKKSLTIFITYCIIGAIVSLIIIIPTRTFIFQPFYVTGDSMKPTYQNNDYLFVSLINKKISRGDIVIVKKSDSPNIPLIKRIVGLPGEKIEIKNGQTFINDSLLSEPYSIGQTISENVVTLSPNQYFIIGDNCDNNKGYGVIDKSEIFGKVVYTAWPGSK